MATFFIGCNVTKPTWRSESVEAALSKEGYALIGKRSEPELPSDFDGLVEVVELSLESKRKASVLLHLYRFESEAAAVDSSFSIVQRHREAGRYINSAVNGKMAAVIEVDERNAAEADGVLEVLKRI